VTEGDDAPVLMRRSLTAGRLVAPLPAGLAFAPFSEDVAHDLHALFTAAYVEGAGDVGEFAAWRDALLHDPEFDPALVFMVRDTSGALAAAAQCWTSAFIKDLAVAQAWWGRGLGDALLARVFAAFEPRGAAHVSLKVRAGNSRARRLYARVGFVAAQ
jgi:ribosomal protein S18 acetylase RimI-like enzyme